MMMTVTDQTNSLFSQSIDPTNQPVVNRTSTATNYDFHRHHSSWHKPTHAIYSPSSNLHSMQTTGANSSFDLTSKSYYPSSTLIDSSFSNFQNHQSTFYRRHTESTLSTLNSFYPTSFHYPSAQTQPAGLYFGWNQHSPLARTHSANYSPSMFASSYPVMNSSSVQMMPDEKITVNGRLPPFGSTAAYSSYLNMMHPIHFNMPSLNVPTTSMNHVVKRSLPSKTTKRSRLTAHLRSEILQLKAQKPTIFVWEIQQNLLQKGICTAQTIPSATVIQRVLNESSKPEVTIKEESKPIVNPVASNSLMKTSSPLTICLSPSPSAEGIDGASASECSICLESYRSGQGVSILACSHEYHSSCIGEWMLKSRSCPMCRKDIHDQPQFVTLLI